MNLTNDIAMLTGIQTEKNAVKCCNYNVFFLSEERQKPDENFFFISMFCRRSTEYKHRIQAVIVLLLSNERSNEKKLHFSYQSFGKQPIKTTAETNHEKGRESGKMQFVCHHG